MADSVGHVVSDFSILALTFIVGILVIVSYFCRISKAKNEDVQADDHGINDARELKEDGITLEGTVDNRSKNKKKVAPDRRGREVKASFNHPWLLTSLKAHSAKVLDLDFSSNGKYLGSCAEDRAVIIWNTKDFTQKERKFVRANVEFDHAKKVKWSPDSKAFIICQANGNSVEVYKLGKKSDGSLGNIQSALVFPKKHEQEIIGIGIACTGKFIMTCSNDTMLTIWDLKGGILDTIDNHLMNTFCASVSPCGRFVACSGFTPDVKVWEVCFSKVGEFKEVTRAFELKGHSAGVYSFSFNNNSTRMATVSKDRTWRIWNTEVEYAKGQDPYLMLTGNYDHLGPSHIALSPDGRAVAIAAGTVIMAFSAVTGKEECRMEDVHSEPIETIVFDPSSKYLLSAGDKHIRVFHNVVGYRAIIEDLEEKRRQVTGQSVKDRIQQQINEARQALKDILEPQE